MREIAEIISAEIRWEKALKTCNQLKAMAVKALKHQASERTYTTTMQYKTQMAYQAKNRVTTVQKRA
mgnify:CR=1 FL=1